MDLRRFYLIGAGILTRAWRIGAVHGAGNAVVLLLFAGSFLLRNDFPMNPPSSAYICSYLGGALALLTGWLGGELVSRLGVGVDNDAGLDASSSLTRGVPPRGAAHPRPSS